MKRSHFIKSFIVFFSILLSKPSRLLENINAINICKKAPYFLLNGYNKNNHNKKGWSLNNFFGKCLILYFHPNDFSSGCSLEAKEFQDNLSKYKRNNASILGISSDKQEDQEPFCTSKKHGYTLLSDINREVSKLYDSWSKSNSIRNTFIIYPKGIVLFNFIGVNPLGHSEEVLKELLKKKKTYA